MPTFLESIGLRKPAEQQQPQNQNSAPSSNMQFNQAGGNNNMGNNQSQANINGDPARGPQNPGNQSGNQEPSDSLAPFAKMWDNPANPEAAPSFSLDPKQLSSLSGSQNFMQGIPPELMQRATSGDSSAMIEMMNLVGQRAYEASLNHGSRLTEGFVSAREAHGQKSFGKNVRAEMTNDALASITESKSPVIQKALRDTANRLQSAYPDASPKEIAEMSKQWVSELYQAMNPNAQQNQQGPNQNQPKETEWDEWFGTPAPR